MKLTYNKLIKNLEKKVRDANKEENVVKWMFYNSDFFCGYSNLGNIAKDEDVSKLNEYIDKYIIDNIPPQYILNKVFFFNYSFYVDGGCFIPRPETEQLVEETIYRIDDKYGKRKISMADVCSGSGAIGITLKKEFPDCDVSLYELSKEAIEIEKKNAKALDADVRVVQGDFITPILENKESFDIILCNPPYIKNDEVLDSLVVDNEPSMALFGGSDGLDFYRIILKEFDNIIKPNGFMGFEFGYDQKDNLEKIVKELLPNHKYEFLKDYNKLDRMLFVYKD